MMGESQIVTMEPIVLSFDTVHERKVTMKTQTAAALSAGLALAFGCSAAAGTIAWGPATAVSIGADNASDVSNTGDLVEAFNATVTGSDYPAAVTVNGVEFVSTRKLLGGDTGTPYDLSAGTNGSDPSYDTLLSSADFGVSNIDNPATIVVGDGDAGVRGAGLLKIGAEYEIQVWFVDDRERQGQRVVSYAGADAGPAVELNDQFAIGTFTATDTTQELVIDPINFNTAHLTAYQIRQIPVEPEEPS